MRCFEPAPGLPGGELPPEAADSPKTQFSRGPDFAVGTVADDQNVFGSGFVLRNAAQKMFFPLPLH